MGEKSGLVMKIWGFSSMGIIFSPMSGWDPLGISTEQIEEWWLSSTPLQNLGVEKMKRRPGNGSEKGWLVRYKNCQERVGSWMPSEENVSRIHCSTLTCYWEFDSIWRPHFFFSFYASPNSWILCLHIIRASGSFLETIF